MGIIGFLAYAGPHLHAPVPESVRETDGGTHGAALGRLPHDG